VSLQESRSSPAYIKATLLERLRADREDKTLLKVKDLIAYFWSCLKTAARQNPRIFATRRGSVTPNKNMGSAASASVHHPQAADSASLVAFVPRHRVHFWS
jgi:hypothetical protein